MGTETGTDTGTEMELAAFADRLDDRLRIADYADVDASENGLQVGPGEATVERAAFAVDAAVETAERAVEADADVLAVHHGLSWGGIDRIAGRTYDRVAALIEGECALYVAHLPLDGHEELGNAAGLADLLDLGERERFGEIGPEYGGLRGRARDPFTVPELEALLNEELDTGGEAVQVLDFGSEEIEEVAVLTGSGADWLGEAAAAGVDAFVTGEGKQQVYHEAREAGINVFLAGHYATETFGVRALRDLAADWGLETTFLDAPTGL